MTEAFTQVSDFGQPADGYILIAPLSEGSREKIYGLQHRFAERFGQESLWLARDDQLHVTFAHIITPNTEYTEGRPELFRRIRPLVTTALHHIITEPLHVKLTFTAVQASPPALIVRAYDDGSLDRLRRMFMDNFQLPDATRRPPNIIHTTLARFRQELDFSAVQSFTEQLMRNFTPFEEVVDRLQLIHEQKIFVQAHEVLETFPPQE